MTIDFKLIDQTQYAAAAYPELGAVAFTKARAMAKTPDAIAYVGLVERFAALTETDDLAGAARLWVQIEAIHTAEEAARLSLCACCGGTTRPDLQSVRLCRCGGAA